MDQISNIVVQGDIIKFYKLIFAVVIFQNGFLFYAVCLYGYGHSKRYSAILHETYIMMTFLFENLLEQNNFIINTKCILLYFEKEKIN